MAIVRSSNYSIVNGRYVMPDEDQGVIRTENIVVRLSETMQPLAKPEVIAAADYPRSTYPVDGLEDCRLNVSHGRTLVSATVRNAAGRDGLARIAVAEYTPGQPPTWRCSTSRSPADTKRTGCRSSAPQRSSTRAMTRAGWRPCGVTVGSGWSSITPRPRRSPAAGVA
ncbi:MAG: hypothetical protein EBR82_83450, partial [Caulobacteraceae bacterium]|nr:hypothetical protein [Caulobacteraceae bacterium]